MPINKTTFAMSALGLLLTGCSALAQQTPPRAYAGNQVLKPVRIVDVPPATKHPVERYSAANCTEPRCHFTVRVTGDCQISLDPQWMAISRRNKVVTIVWELKDSPGYSFARDAIFNKPRPEDTVNPFGALKLMEGNIATVEYKNNPGHTQEYGIKIARGADVCGTLDPPIYPDS